MARTTPSPKSKKTEIQVERATIPIIRHYPMLAMVFVIGMFVGAIITRLQEEIKDTYHIIEIQKRDYKNDKECLKNMPHVDDVDWTDGMHKIC